MKSREEIKKFPVSLHAIFDKDTGKTTSVFFDDMNFQIIKINTVNKIILGETSLGVAFKFCDGRIKPDGLA